MRAGVIRNPRAHAHRRGRRGPEAGAPVAEPATPEALREVLRAWAATGVERIVVDGGDGTVREVLGALPEVWSGRPVKLAVLPSGKTNALAHDLGAPRGWTTAAALHAGRTVSRSPLEVERRDGKAAVRRGFVMGVGAFTDAVALAQHLHAAGLVGGLAVGAALAASAARAMFGRPSDPWRGGRPMRLGCGDGPDEEGRRLLVLLSTLERLPLGLRPFGAPRPGLKLLEVSAPARRLAAALPRVAAGRDPPWLAQAGYRRRDAQEVRLSTPAPFILDGELFDGGDLRIRRGAPVTFVAP